MHFLKLQNDNIAKFLNSSNLSRMMKRLINTIVIQSKILKIILPTYALLYLPLSARKSKLAQRLNIGPRPSRRASLTQTQSHPIRNTASQRQRIKLRKVN